ncbi:MAG: CPBP family glutamic-type intramembrane protease, partial [Polyangiaceae bacterium]|nr:CPBP family glutamic-type intramembrane protease [Polyangiaceae bacterium]
KHLSLGRFAWMSGEGVFYAIIMRLLAGYAVAYLLAWVSLQGHGMFALMKAAPALSSSVAAVGDSAQLGARVSGAIMSLGAGFYEEMVFRVLIFGAGGALILFLFNITTKFFRFWFKIGWAVAAACVFSGWHYVGDMGEVFELSTFAFRTVCGLVFTAIYHLRGFAPAVWTHALYDLWVLAF